MATIDDIGTPGAPLSDPPLTEWQAAVRDRLNTMTSSLGSGVTCTSAAGGPPPAINLQKEIPLLSMQTQWGDSNVVDLSELGSGYFRLNASGVWRFDASTYWLWSGDGLFQQSSVMVDCASGYYVQGYGFALGSLGAANRVISGVCISGTFYQGIEMPNVGHSFPTFTGITATVSATFLGRHLG